jgi:hypothetical protein
VFWDLVNEITVVFLIVYVQILILVPGSPARTMFAQFGRKIGNGWAQTSGPTGQFTPHLLCFANRDCIVLRH